MISLAYALFRVWHRGRCAVEAFCRTCDVPGTPKGIIYADAVGAILALGAAIEVILR